MVSAGSLRLAFTEAGPDLKSHTTGVLMARSQETASNSQEETRQGCHGVQFQPNHRRCSEVELPYGSCSVLRQRGGCYHSGPDICLLTGQRP